MFDFRVQAMHPPLDDATGGGGWLAPMASWTKSEKMLRGLRRDLLAGVAAVVRELPPRSPQIVVGIGQGGLVAALLTRPRLVELALAGRHAAPDEGVELSRAWHSVRAVVVWRPRLLPNFDFGLAATAIQEMGHPTASGEEPHPVFAREDPRNRVPGRAL